MYTKMVEKYGEIVNMESEFITLVLGYKWTVSDYKRILYQ
jgi:hypothetical protein